MTIAIASGSKTNIISKRNQFTTLFIGYPVTSARYLRGPNSLWSSFDISKLSISLSNLSNESCTASNLTFMVSRSPTVFFSSLSNALLAELDVVVINCPDCLSTYCTCAGLDNEVLKSVIV